jgi:hypothetical protein
MSSRRMSTLPVRGGKGGRKSVLGVTRGGGVNKAKRVTFEPRGGASVGGHRSAALEKDDGENVVEGEFHFSHHDGSMFADWTFYVDGHSRRASGDGRRVG